MLTRLRDHTDVYAPMNEMRVYVVPYDPRWICTHPSDYANPIEPSGSGGSKIARAIANALALTEATLPCRVFAG